MKKQYLVCWMKKKRSSVSGDVYKDRYRVFIDGTSGENFLHAQQFYNKVIEKGKTYSANLCEIKQSTDY